MTILMITMILFEENMKTEKLFHNFIYCFSLIFQHKYIILSSVHMLLK